MRKNWMTTAGGIMALFIGLPTILAASHLNTPNWFSVACIVIGTLGGGLVGLAAKGQDEHSTVSQVEASTQVKDVEEQVKKSS